MAAVRVIIEDGLGNRAVYGQLPVTAEVEGPITLAGPSVFTAEGGAAGLYIKTAGETGTGVLTLTAPGVAPVQLSFSVQA
jgi:beta-galactosidase